MSESYVEAAVVGVGLLEEEASLLGEDSAGVAVFVVESDEVDEDFFA